MLDVVHTFVRECMRSYVHVCVSERVLECEHT